MAEFHRGNDLLKARGVAIEWTDELLAERIRCRDDIVYFANHYMKIVTTDGELVTIGLRDYQEEIVRSFNDYRRTIITQCRQSGKTTVATAIILHQVLFNRYQRVAIVANKEDTAIEILERIQIAYELLPAWLQQGVVDWNKKTVKLENGSKIMAAATSSSAIRGKSVSLLYIDETAHIDNWDKFYASVYPTLSGGKKSKVIFTSTPNGLNHFYRFWKEALIDHKDKDWNGFNHVEVNWWQVPGRDEEWKEAEIKGLGGDLDKFAQEHENQFLGSQGTLISGQKLKLLRAAQVIRSNWGLKQYEDPIKEHIYCLVADVSEGKGLDYSAFNIIDVTSIPYKQVCVFRNNMVTPTDYAEYINRMARTYNMAHVLIEKNNMGIQVVELLHHDFEYEYLLSTKSNGAQGKVISTNGGELGIRTTTPVKANGCSLLKLLVEQDKLIVNDADTIEEFAHFARHNKTYKADEGHDDLTMSLVLFSWLTAQDYFKALTDTDIINSLRERNEDQMVEDLVPFGFIVDHHNDDEELVTYEYDGFKYGEF